VDTVRVALTRTRQDVARLFSGYRWGGYKRKIGVLTQYEYSYFTASQREILEPSKIGSIELLADSVQHAGLFKVFYEDVDFVKWHRLNGFLYTEDVTLGLHLELDYGRSFTPGFDRYLFDIASLIGRYAVSRGPNLLILTYSQTHWFRQKDEFRKNRSFSVRFLNNGLDFLTTAILLQYESDQKPNRTNNLSLGGESGLRGYPEFFQTGAKKVVLNMEGRFFPGIELLSVLFGGVLFADMGRAYKEGEPVAMRDLDYSVGAGLRISPEKLTKSELIRIDFTRLNGDSWEVSFGTGQYF
jgi:hypothetical protein